MQLKLAFSNYFNDNVEKILFLKLKLLGLLFFAYFIMRGPGVKTRYFSPTCYLQKTLITSATKQQRLPKPFNQKK
jgi:hypothetical protein